MPRANYLEKQVTLVINYIFSWSLNARKARKKFKTSLLLNFIFSLRKKVEKSSSPDSQING